MNFLGTVMLELLSPSISFDGLSLAHCLLFCFFRTTEPKIQKNGLLRVSACLWVIMLLFKALLQRRKSFVFHFLCIRQPSITKHQVIWKASTKHTKNSNIGTHSVSLGIFLFMSLNDIPLGWHEVQTLLLET